jgi:hypothetical protein
VPDARGGRKWPYQNAKPVRRRRVVRASEPAAARGVRRREPPAPRLYISPRRARVMLAGAMLLGFVSFSWWAYGSSYLTVGEPQVTGASQLSPQQVRAAAGITGDSIFGLDLEDARERVEALPKVRSATIEKRGWSGVAIHVEERAPSGAWQIEGVNLPVDIDGYILDGEAPADVPVIVEVEPRRVLKPGDRVDAGAVELAARLAQESDTALERRVQALLYRQNSGLTAVFASSDVDGKPLWVTFGDSRDYDYKMATLYVLMEQAREKRLALNAVDLRFGDRLSFN